jgi:hypothetical protein
MKEMFTSTEKRIIEAMLKLDRFANANEIAKVANDLSWATTKNTLIKLWQTKKILDMKLKNKLRYYRIKEELR